MPRRIKFWMLGSLAAFSIAALAVGLQRAHGGNIWQEFGIRINNPLDSSDDQFVVYRQRWADESQPVQFYLFRDFFGNVMNPVFYGTVPEADISPDDARRQIEHSVKSWNGNSFSDFEFSDFLPFAGHQDAVMPFVDPPAFFPVDRTAFDGVNLIIFQDPSIALPAGVVGIASTFILNQDFDATTLLNRVPFELVDDLGDPNIAVFDFDFDGNYDVVLPLRKFKQGEFLDADIVFNSLEPGYILLPEDPNDFDGPQQDILGSLDIAVIATHELGHAHGLGHANVFESSMYFAVDSASVQSSQGNFIFLRNPYNYREPRYDDWVAQALQYPGGNPGNRGVFAGEVLNGDFLDTINDGTEPLRPQVLQVPVYLTRQVPNLNVHPDNTNLFETDSGSYIEGGQTAHFASEPNALPVPFRKVASAPSGLEMTLNLAGPLGDPVNAPPEIIDSTFYIPGVPLTDGFGVPHRYAVYTDNPALQNVNPVMATLAPGEIVPPEFWGGANAPGFGMGAAFVNNEPGDNKIANNFIEVTLDAQCRASIGIPGRSVSEGIPLTSGHPFPERARPVFKVDNATIDTGKQMPGTIISPVIISDASNVAIGRWLVAGKLELTWEVRISAVGGRDLEPIPAPPNDISITYRFRNVSGSTVAVGVKQIWDLIALGSEGPAYFVDGTQLHSATTFTGAAVPKYLVYQNSVMNPLVQGVLTLTGAGTGVNPPSKLVIDRANRISNTDFGGGNSGTNISSLTGRLKNTGAAVIFDPVMLPAGETTAFTVMLGALSDETALILDTGHREGAEGTIWYDNPNVAEEVTPIAGGVVDGLTIITDTADGTPDFQVPLPPGARPPEGAIFTMRNDLIPQESWGTVDVAIGDIDNDGDLDIVLAITNVGDGQPSFNRLLENRFIPDGELRFVDVTFGPDGIPGTGDDRLPVVNEPTTGVVMADFDNDGFMDIFFTNAFYAEGSITSPGINRLYRNRGDGSFEDVTFFEPLPGFPVVPGILDDTFNRLDTSLKPAVGDIDGDGDIDIIIPLWNRFTGPEIQGIDGRDSFHDIVFTPDSEIEPPPPDHFDGLMFIAPLDGGEAHEVDMPFGPLSAPARVLVNQLMETGQFFFLDDTLGRNHTFGGFQPVGGVISPQNLDRMPPVAPEPLRLQGSQSENVMSAQAVLGPFVGDNSLDLALADTSRTGVSPNFRLLQGYPRLYNNLDFTGNLRPDGYFQQINFGAEFVFYPRVGDTQTDLFPLLLSVPTPFPDSGGATNPAEVFPHTQANITAITIADLDYSMPMVVASASTAESYFYRRRIAPNSDPPAIVNLTRGREAGVPLGGIGMDFFVQFPGIDQTISHLGDRYPNVGDPFTLPFGFPPAGQVLHGDPWDIAEDTPSDSGAPAGEVMRYDIPNITIGQHDQVITLPTNADGWRTQFVVAGDFRRAGAVDLIFLNDILGHESTAPGGSLARNYYFQNNGFGEMELNETALTVEPAAPSRAAAVGDFDNDGDLDVYVANWGAQDHLLVNFTFHNPPDPDSISDDIAPMFYNDSVNMLAPMYNVSLSADVADISGNGRQDLIVGSGVNTSIEGDPNVLYYNTGEPLNPGVKTLLPVPFFHPAPALGFFGEISRGETTAVKFGDIDNDGDFDIVDVNYGTGPRAFINIDSDDTDFNTLPDADSLGDGLFVEVFNRFPLLDNPLCGFSGIADPKKLLNTSMAMADLTGNGLLDIVIGNGGGVGAPNVILINGMGGNPPGFFSEETEARLPTITFPVEIAPGVFEDCTQGINDDTGGVVLGDFNHDGFIDIFFANSTTPQNPGLPSHRLLLNDGSGFFIEASDRLPADLPVGQVTCVAIGDFDGLGERTEDVNYNGVLDPGFDITGDGFLDSGEDSIYSNVASNLGSVIPDNGVIDFEDLNGNGIADLSLDVFIGYYDGPDILLLNDGDGFLVDASNRLLTAAPTVRTTAVAVGDVTLDGRLDIVYGYDGRDLTDPDPRVTNTIGLLLNKGSALMVDASYEIDQNSAIALYPNVANNLNGWPRAITLFDIDNDGDLDIFVAQAGTVTGGNPIGYLDYVMINRLRGDNFNAELTDVAQVPGKPIIKVISPPGALPGDELVVQMVGFNIEPGSQFDFGPGIEVLETMDFWDRKQAKARIRINPAAAVGPRVVSVQTPYGQDGHSNLGAFSVLGVLPPGGFVNAARGSWAMYEVMTPDNIVGPPIPSPPSMGRFE